MSNNKNLSSFAGGQFLEFQRSNVAPSTMIYDIGAPHASFKTIYAKVLPLTHLPTAEYEFPFNFATDNITSIKAIPMWFNTTDKKLYFKCPTWDVSLQKFTGSTNVRTAAWA